MKSLGLFLLLVIAGVHGEHSAETSDEFKLPENRWVNDYDDKLLFTCPASETIEAISSQHHNHHEDRQWDFQCRKSFSQQPSCAWSHYVNNFDEEFTFTCPFNSIISGVESYHQNHEEDRRWKFYCCRVENVCNKNCFWTNYLNLFDEYFSWQVPESSYLVSVSSYHDNYHEDRRWKYQYCEREAC
ncbi:hemagglutinin/amebocyte aggregation factor-like [Hemitrygon akajei]|uniref:hemagglutinin/amebocyte aggregation factor-like n=1 Tax=Hemitrygon akajei TaxID=2704970 RepID=UPI003BFA3200